METAFDLLCSPSASFRCRRLQGKILSPINSSEVKKKNLQIQITLIDVLLSDKIFICIVPILIVLIVLTVTDSM